MKINKLCIDSGYRTPMSKSDTDFSIELPESILLPPGTVCMVTDVSLPHAWYTIEHNQNDKLYIRYQSTIFNHHDFVLEIEDGNYNMSTLATAVEEVLTLPAIRTTIPTVQPYIDLDSNKGKFLIHTSSADAGTFYILSDSDLKQDSIINTWNGALYNPSNLQSINNIIANYGVNKQCMYAMPFESGFVDTLTHHNIYIKCPQLGSFQNVGPRGKKDILKKIVVTAAFGEMITETLINSDDYTDCSRLHLKTRNFRITDVNDNTISLHGQRISFSFVF